MGLAVDKDDDGNSKSQDDYRESGENKDQLWSCLGAPMLSLGVCFWTRFGNRLMCCADDGCSLRLGLRNLDSSITGWTVNRLAEHILRCFKRLFAFWTVEFDIAHLLLLLSGEQW